MCGVCNCGDKQPTHVEPVGWRSERQQVRTCCPVLLLPQRHFNSTSYQYRSVHTTYRWDINSFENRLEGLANVAYDTPAAA
mmetsp:Transcript_3711/g.5244  ORF Transcript_3711/g.5244 Transcript_3711/m.5244 type:complete len:81 (+) Transcript_3711:161-403(+)